MICPVSAFKRVPRKQNQKDMQRKKGQRLKRSSGTFGFQEKSVVFPSISRFGRSIKRTSGCCGFLDIIIGNYAPSHPSINRCLSFGIKGRRWLCECFLYSVEKSIQLCVASGSLLHILGKDGKARDGRGRRCEDDCRCGLHCNVWNEIYNLMVNCYVLALRRLVTDVRCCYVW